MRKITGTSLLLCALPLNAAQIFEYRPPHWPLLWDTPLPLAAVPSAASTGDPDPAQPAKDATAAPAATDESERANRDQQYQAALSHMRNGDYAKAYCLWQPLAEGGHAEAQFSLGWMYHNGYGLNIDNQQTLEWWQKAADQGLQGAAFALGMLYSQGDDAVDPDLARAVSYFRQAALAGNDEAAAMLRKLFVSHAEEMTALSADWKREDWSLLGSDEIRVAAPEANARSAPSADAPVLERLEQGQPLIKLTEQGKWIRAMRPDQDQLLWIYSTLVEPASAEGM